MKIPFSVSARTAMLIGAENFSNPEGAIVELVKNAYDADSQVCYIFFYEDNHSNKCIYIIDLGCGMTSETIKDCWMRIGTEDKVNNVVSAKGRIKSGAKGIGRFALNRLGKIAEMITFTGATNGYKWIVDWRSFDIPNVEVSQVTASIDTICISEARKLIKAIFENYNEAVPQFSTGTILKICELNDEWTNDKIEHLFYSLRELIPPFNNTEFEIVLRVSNLDKYGLIENNLNDEYDYRVESKYDENRKKIFLSIYRNELDEIKLLTEYKGIFEFENMKKFPYTEECFKNKFFSKEVSIYDLNIDSSFIQKNIDKLGDFKFNFYFIKSSISDAKGEDDISKYPYKKINTVNRKNLLRNHGGVKIYRDNFRVRPYGENGDDWLHLGDRYAKNPIGAGQRLGGYHIRQNQIIGAVEISRIINKSLQDKSGREGLQENDVFRLFKLILLAIINEMEVDRNYIMFYLSKLFDKNNPRRRKQIEAEKIINNQHNDENVNIVKEGYNALKDELEEKNNETRLLRNLATTGLVIATFAHELKNISVLLKSRADDLKESILNIVSEDDPKLSRVSIYENPYYIAENIKTQDQKIYAWLNFSINSVIKDKRNRKTFSLNEYFKNFKSAWSVILKDLNIKLKITIDSSSILIHAFIVDLDTIFNNLLSNSIYAIKQSCGEQRFVEIIINSNKDYIYVKFNDSGIGLDHKYFNDPNKIFNAFETSKCDANGNFTGTGLGLYIIKTIIDEYKGWSISVNTSLKIGFGICLTMKRC